MIGGARTSSPQGQNSHPLEESLEPLKGPPSEVRSSYAAVFNPPLDDDEGVLLSPKPSRNSPEDADGPANNASRVVRLGKHGRPNSQTSQDEFGNINDLARPPRRQVSHILAVHSVAISVFL